MADENTAIPNADTNAPAPSDNPIDRAIDIALEAQDGPGTHTATESGTEVKAKDGENPPVDTKGGTSATGDGTAQQQPPKKGEEEAKQTHGAKDLTDAQGNVIAKGGAERRFYEQRETARQQAQHYQKQFETTQQQLEAARREVATMRETSQQLNGMDPNTLRIGAQIVTDLQRDPVGTMKKLLAEVVAQGHTIDAIGTGVDTLAIQRMIDARLPDNSNAERMPTDDEILAEAQVETNAFFARYPDARPHDALLGRMLRDHPGVDLDTAYFQLKNGFAEKGLDWSLSLEDNLKSQSVSPTTDTPQPKPLPNGRAAVADNTSTVGDVKIAHEDTDMGDIVKQAMREQGLNIN